MTSRREMDRRDALKLLATGAGLAALDGCAPTVRAAAVQRAGLGPAPRALFAAPPIDTVRIGFVGVGGMGSAHVQNLLKIEGCVIRAIDDIVPEKVTRMQDMVQQAGFPRPAGYSRGPTDFLRMCEEQERDLVYNATPWEWHVPIC